MGCLVFPGRSFQHHLLKSIPERLTFRQTLYLPTDALPALYSDTISTIPLVLGSTLFRKYRYYWIAIRESPLSFRD